MAEENLVLFIDLINIWILFNAKKKNLTKWLELTEHLHYSKVGLFNDMCYNYGNYSLLPYYKMHFDSPGFSSPDRQLAELPKPGQHCSSIYFLPDVLAQEGTRGGSHMNSDILDQDEIELNTIKPYTFNYALTAPRLSSGPNIGFRIQYQIFSHPRHKINEPHAIMYHLLFSFLDVIPTPCLYADPTEHEHEAFWGQHRALRPTWEAAASSHSLPQFSLLRKHF